jgi:hypothetical protein
LTLASLYSTFNVSCRILFCDKIRKKIWARPLARRETGEVHAKVWGKPNGKRKLGICRHRWEVVIKMNLQQLEWEDIDWITQDKDG